MRLIYFLLFFISSNCWAIDTVPYTVFIKAGTILHSLKDKKDVVLSKGIYAKVMENDPEKRESYFVYDKKGIAQYEMNSLGVVEITEDTSLLPNMDARKEYPPQNAFKAEDKVALFDTSFNLHFDNIQVSQLNEIYEDRIPSVVGARVEVSTFYQSELPYKFGLNLNYESAYWKNDFEEVKLSILSVGPYFKYHFFSEDNFKFYAVLGAELAPIYQTTTALFTDKYSAQLYDLGFESVWESPIGLVSFGSHFRHHEIALNKNSRNQESQTPKEFSLNSIGVMIGYKIVWDL